MADAAPRHLLHVPQQASWDCGLACLAMIVSTLEHMQGSPGVGPSCAVAPIVTTRHATRMLRHLGTLAATTSTWTIDLAFVLQQLGIPFELRSTHLGVNTGLGGLAFYSGFLDADSERVSSRQRELAALASPLFRAVETKTNLAVLRDAVSDGSHVCVVLTDARRLAERSGAASWLSWASSGQDDWFLKMDEAGFRGHYVLLVAWRGHEGGASEARAPPPEAPAASAAVATSAARAAPGEAAAVGTAEAVPATPVASFPAEDGGESSVTGDAGFLDPGAPVARIRWLPARQFDAARLARGTDSDVIIVSLDQAQREWASGATAGGPAK
ncbi:hypothetical protein FNF27_00923 [Cafeteria roenbergensis]|uniref:Guanylyl cyclase n=1 Tax=Cafeteria roenbergensis TaxID=33653 RepID=A0A5A8EPV6_CAFRO|nr:hypothetical protein FNF27_00923 [Cafeteria roenbergensis]|mmetsp:Transcript_20295/g.77932  ORF Transcript_20295/g.77932 Transcript_20295/m.77932 type:complete len:328 (+) Transcript_20295:101-1084(+)